LFGGNNAKWQQKGCDKYRGFHTESLTIRTQRAQRKGIGRIELGSHHPIHSIPKPVRNF
jgi:hypothetical protein